MGVTCSQTRNIVRAFHGVLRQLVTKLISWDICSLMMASWQPMSRLSHHSVASCIAMDSNTQQKPCADAGHPPLRPIHGYFLCNRGQHCLHTYACIHQDKKRSAVLTGLWQLVCLQCCHGRLNPMLHLHHSPSRSCMDARANAIAFLRMHNCADLWVFLGRSGAGRGCELHGAAGLPGGLAPAASPSAQAAIRWLCWRRPFRGACRIWALGTARSLATVQVCQLPPLPSPPLFKTTATRIRAHAGASAA